MFERVNKLPNDCYSWVTAMNIEGMNSLKKQFTDRDGYFQYTELKKALKKIPKERLVQELALAIYDCIDGIQTKASCFEELVSKIGFKLFVNALDESIKQSIKQAE